MGFLTNEGLERLWNHICSGFNNLQSQINNLNIPSDYVPSTRKINNKELSEDVIINASDACAVSLSAEEGMSIAENSDLNTIDFLSVGSYYCSSGSKVSTLTNCPTPNAFIMHVYSPISFSNIGKESTNPWVYRLRKIIDVTGAEYTQYVNSGSTVGEFNYRDWAQTLKTNTKLVTDSQNYGTTLPTTGVEGQIFFKKVT